MSKYRISIDAVCPFYSSEDAYKIRCEGLVEDSTTHVVFPNPKDKLDYKRKFCHTKYKECLLASALYVKYGGDDDD